MASRIFTIITLLLVLVASMSISLAAHEAWHLFANPEYDAIGLCIGECYIGGASSYEGTQYEGAEWVFSYIMWNDVDNDPKAIESQEMHAFIFQLVVMVVLFLGYCYWAGRHI